MNNARILHIKKEINEQIAKSGWTLTGIVKQMNFLNPDHQITPQNISNKLSKGTIRYSEVKQIADIIDCELKWVPKE